MDNLASPARFHYTHEATATAPLPAPGFSPTGLAALPLPARLAAQLRRQLPAPRLGLRACVIVPAKDEAAGLPASLAALAAQADDRGRPLPPDSWEVLVLANNCQDSTAAVVRQFARRHPALALHVAELTLPPEVAHVGQARRLLLDEAARRLEAGGAGPRALLLSTDADTVVAPTWLWAARRAVRAGAAAVGGRILPESGPAPCPVRRIHLLDATYRLLLARLENLVDPNPHDPWPRHHQHFGASLALTVAAYRQVGGLPVVPFLEDAALCDQLRAHDLPLRHCPRMWVRTSCRQLGRVEVGLSWQLREWARLGDQPQQEHHVPDPVELRRVWGARRPLRAWHAADAPAATRELAHLARQLEVPLPELLAEARQATTFGRLWQWVEARRGAVLPVPLSRALPELRRLLREAGAWKAS